MLHIVQGVMYYMTKNKVYNDPKTNTTKAKRRTKPLNKLWYMYLAETNYSKPCWEAGRGVWQTIWPSSKTGNTIELACGHEYMDKNGIYSI